MVGGKRIGVTSGTTWLLDVGAGLNLNEEQSSATGEFAQTSASPFKGKSATEASSSYAWRGPKSELNSEDLSI